MSGRARYGQQAIQGQSVRPLRACRRGDRSGTPFPAPIAMGREGYRFRGRRCVYCGRDGACSTSDHEIARGFFLKTARENLPQVPACVSCNNEKARLEQHLLTVLPFGAQHAAAAQTLNELLPGAA
jgi:hypothetical protein